MKNTALAVSTPVTNVCCDVSMDKINLMCVALSKPGMVAEWEVPNRSESILETLRTIQQRAQTLGISELRVVVEPTGIYHELLLRLARRLGFTTSLVDPSHVAKVREVVFGDPGKTDERDPRAIAHVAEHGRLIADRQFPEVYELLRTWTRLYQQAEEAMIVGKNRLHRILKRLFPDFDFTTDFLYSASGEAIFRTCRFNPRRIVRHSAGRLYKRLRLRSRIYRMSVERLLRQARASVGSTDGGRIAELLEHELTLAWEDVERQQRRRDEARVELERLYDEARTSDPRLPAEQHNVVSKCALARLVGELGPMSDYESWRQALRMGGLNLCERKSGRYVGQTKISRKGRPLVRVIVNQMALPLVKRTRLFGEYYFRKTTIEKMEGKKAMTAVGRKILKMIWGWYQSAGAFDPARVFACESAHRRAA